MQKLNIQQEFDYPLDLLLRAREERYQRLDKFPELKNVRLVLEEKTEDVLKQVRHISIGESLPPVLSAVLPGMDTLYEDSEFQLKENVHIFKITPGNKGDVFTINGRSRYLALDENRSRRDYDMEITSKTLFVGGGIEIAVAGIYRHQLEKDQTSIINFIKLLQEEDSSGSAS